MKCLFVEMACADIDNKPAKPDRILPFELVWFCCDDKARRGVPPH
jgi:hypothetical protein